MAATGERCRNCDAPLAADARFCARCGRMRGEAAPPMMVELTPFGAPPTPPAEQRAVVTTAPPDRRRTLLLLGVLAVVALVAFGVTRLVGDDGSDAAPAPPTSSVPGSGATGVTTTVAPTTSAAPVTTTAAPTTTSSTTVPVTTTTIPYVNQRRGLVLDEAQRDKVLFVVAGRTLLRVELGTGRVTVRQGVEATYGTMGVGAGRLIFPEGRVIDTDLAGDVVPVVLPAGFSIMYPPTVNPRGVWSARYPSTPRDETVVRLVGFDGRTLAERHVPAGLSVAGVIDDVVFVSGYGRIFRIGADDVVTPYALGVADVVAGSFVLWSGCDDRGRRCTYHLGTATNPDTGRTSLETTYLYAGGGGEGGYRSVLAPDGATIVAIVYSASNDGRMHIVDLATGSVLGPVVADNGGVAFTPDGSWLMAQDGIELVAINVRNGQQRRIALPVVLGPNPFVLAIG